MRKTSRAVEFATMTHTTTTTQATPTHSSPLRVGLTGGIGSGKSTVCALFQALGTPVIDADQAAREVVAPGSAGLNEVWRIFGADVLTPEGGLDRAALRERVFRRPEERKKLEAVLHPRIYESMARQGAALSTPYVLFAVPLLVETNHHRDMDRVLVVDLPDLKSEIGKDTIRVGAARAERVTPVLATRRPRPCRTGSMASIRTSSSASARRTPRSRPRRAIRRSGWGSA